MAQWIARHADHRVSMLEQALIIHQFGTFATADQAALKSSISQVLA